MNKLPPNITLGTVRLTIDNLDRSRTYYTHNIGLTVLKEENGRLTLGTPNRPLLELTEQPGVTPARGHSGLYHFALLVPSRPELGRTLRHLAQTKTAVGGWSDHNVSEAIYLTDPDGHGIEIYRDRPRETWEFDSGTLRMGLDPFDAEGVLAAGSDLPDAPTIHPNTIMGHVHLHVAHIPAAETFYNDVLGFDLMVRYGSQASFISAGGYHHHLGLNVWAGVGAPPPPPEKARLLSYDIHLPSPDALPPIVARLEANNIPYTKIEGGIETADPAQNTIRLLTPPIL